MKKRTKRPTNNKYYIRTVSGGYNGAVSGKPAITGANVLCNCVGYANGRFNEIINDPELKGIALKFKYQLVTNAENFIESAKAQGLKISDKPIEGGVMVWKKGATLGGKDGAGHVAVVEAVYDDGSIQTSESGWNAYAFKLFHRDNSNGRWGQPGGYAFRGCIVNPGVKNPKTVPAPKLTVDGIGGPSTVRAMQRFFGTAQDGVISGQKKEYSKYYPALISVKYGSGGSPTIKKLQKWTGVKEDGILGPNTVKAWQKKIGVKADGIFGKGSVKAWQKYLNSHDKAVYPANPTPTPEPKPNPTPTPKPSTNAEKLLDKVNEFAWPYGTKAEKYSYSTGSAKPAYKAALKKYMNKSAKVSQTDCGYFVSTCVRAAGISSSFLALKGSNEAFQKPPSGLVIVHKGKKIPDGLLKPGDIIRYKKTSGQHTMIFVSTGKIAEAQRPSAKKGLNYPAIKKDTKKYNNKNVKFSTLEVLRAK